MQELILSTDMTSHFKFIERLKKLGESEVLTQSGDQVVKWYYLKSLIKLADISNPCRSAKVAQMWALAYVNENRAMGGLLKE